MSGAALHLFHHRVASVDKPDTGWITAIPMSQFLFHSKESYIQIFTVGGLTGWWREQGTHKPEWERERSEVVNGEGKKHTYSFTSDWRTSADRDQIEKATYPSPSLPPPPFPSPWVNWSIVVLTWPWCASLPEEAAMGKTSLVLKKKKPPCEHRLDKQLRNNIVSPVHLKSLSELLSMSHRFSEKARDVFFPQAIVHLFIQSWQDQMKHTPLSYYL